MEVKHDIFWRIVLVELLQADKCHGSEKCRAEGITNMLQFKMLGRTRQHDNGDARKAKEATRQHVERRSGS